MTTNADRNTDRQVKPGSWIRLAQWLWMLGAVVMLIILIASIPGYRLSYQRALENLTAAPPIPAAGIAFLEAATSLSIALLSVVLAVVIFWRKRENNIALLVSFLVIMMGVGNGGTVQHFEEVFPSLDGLYQVSSVFSGALFIFFLLLFPNGTFVPRWTRSLVFVIFLWVPFISLPLANESNSIVSVILYAGVLSLPFTGLLAQIYRYRRVSSPTEKQQTKWVLFGIALLLLLTLAIAIIGGPLRSTLFGEQERWWVEKVIALIYYLIQGIFPTTLALAVLQTRLWDIDIIIRRTLQYSILTSVLALIYFGGVVLTQFIFRNLTGNSDTPMITVISTLAIAALFNPLRYRVQDFIDRRFYRKKYDAEQALENFSTIARDEVDIDKLTKALLGVVEETIQPESLSLWLKGESK